MTTVPSTLAAMMVELSQAWDVILDKYVDKPDMKYIFPLALHVEGEDGEVVARFMEEGIDFFPEVERGGMDE